MGDRFPLSLAFVLVLAFVLGGGAACSAGTPEDSFVVGAGEVADDQKADQGSAAGGAELKVTIAPGAIDATRDLLGLDADDGERREVWFYDTPALDGFAAGLVLRARKVIDDDDDSTVKLRPLGVDEVAATWPGTAGFKCETDATPTRSVSSCSLTVAQDQGEIDAVADGDRAIDRLFSSAQERLLVEQAPDVSWGALVALGPTDVVVWKIEGGSLPAPMTAEWWRLPAGDLLELSIKVPEDEVAAGFDALLGWLDARGLALDGTQETKTRRALEEHAAAAR